jgi:predicted ferric reductase
VAQTIALDATDAGRASNGRHRRADTQFNPPTTVRPPAGGGRRRRGDIAALLAGIGGGLAIGSSLAVLRPMWQTPGGPATVLGSVSAIAGTYLVLMLLLLISRLPWLEREAGHDRMLRWHRRLAPWSLVLIAAHVVLTTVGYAQGLGVNPLIELWELVSQYPWMLPATVAFITMMSLGFLSWRPIRKRMSYETWWVAHLYFYLAVALAFGHQITTGTIFTAHAELRYAWVVLYAAVGITIIICRFVLPVRRSIRHELRVSRVVQESRGMVSVYVTGHDLGALNAQGGQFFQWRFLTRNWWWQAHPYSLSAAPGDALRITVKNLGDQSSSLARELRPGTRVLAEGPYGTFTAAARSGERVAALAAGVGITPVRAMLDDLPATADVCVLYRVSSLDDVALRDELDAMVAACGWTLVYLDGPRRDHPITLNYLSRYIPDLADRDIYVCGPESFAGAVVAAARTANVPDERLHCESFAF